MTEILKWVKDKGIFVKFRFGKKPFNPVLQDRTKAVDDILKKQKERQIIENLKGEKR